MDTVCRTDDEFVQHKPRWVVVLSNGETIYQDDDRPGMAEPSAWLRLGKYCRDRDLHISELWMQFQTNRFMVGPPDADGYYFVRTASAVWGDEETIHGYIAGVLLDGKIRGYHWIIPAFIPLEIIEREPDFNSPLLIARQLTFTLP